MAGFRRDETPAALPASVPPIDWVRRARWAQYFGLAIDQRFIEVRFSPRAAYRQRVDEYNATAKLPPLPTHEEAFTALRTAAHESGIGAAFDVFIAERERPRPTWLERQASRR